MPTAELGGYPFNPGRLIPSVNLGAIPDQGTLTSFSDPYPITPPSDFDELQPVVWYF